MNACARREPEPATTHHGNLYAPTDKAGVEKVALILQQRCMTPPSYGSAGGPASEKLAPPAARR
eukprot:9486028-Alexandrium_andersonii.AAC.1